MKESNIKSLDKTLKEHYSSKSLSGNQLNTLLSMQVNSIESEKSSRVDSMSESKLQSKYKSSRFRRLLPYIQSYRYAFYVTAFLLMGSMLAVYKLLDQAALTPFSQRIMSEIVYNHKQDMPIEVSSNSLNDIGKYLSKLDFSIVLPSSLSNSEWQFLGGRYCSLNGKLAAQLKVKNLKSNVVYTLYQAHSDVSIGNLEAEIKNDVIEGIDVSIWREQGLLLGMAIENRTLLK